MQDVARAAGVSMMTVSNVINGRPHVRGATREKVLKAIGELDYRVNVAARNLRAGRTGTIGLAVPGLDRPYFGQLAARLVEEAAREDLRLVLEQTGASRDKELEALFLASNRLYDALILSTVGLSAADANLLRVDYPVVLLGERIFESPVDHIAMPNVEGARAAVEHLLERGCRRIAMIGGEDTDEVHAPSLRFSGYRAALEGAGVPYDPALLVRADELSLAAGAAAARGLVESGTPFDGVFCVTDTMALGVLRGLHDVGVSVPEQARVIGFDDIEEATYSSPSLSSVNPDHDWMARKAVELIVQRMAEPGTNAHVELESEFRVIERESTR
jgi:DNA-binding LacI/PurR family transcriptional regulator